MAATKVFHRSAMSIALVLACSNVSAFENGTTGYPRGIVTVMSGAVGQPGETYIYTYNTYTDIASIKDGGGKKVFPKAKGRVEAHAVRLVHVLKDAPKIFGGDLALEVALPYVDGHMNIPSLGPNGKGTTSGLADPMFGALVSWVSPTYLQNVAVDVVAPWGKYDKNDLLNSGANSSAAYLSYAFTWFPVQYFELSSKISMNYSFRNPDTDYKSGVQLIADYGANFRLGPNWLAGVGGFVSTQLNDDEQDGRSVGNRSRSTKFGPQVGYAKRGWGVFAAYQKDVYTRNAPSGDTFMINGFIKF